MGLIFIGPINEFAKAEPGHPIAAATFPPEENSPRPVVADRWQDFREIQLRDQESSFR
jgi:hypothetical protein